MPTSHAVVASSKKSTTVRSVIPRLVQLAFRTAAQVAPSAAERGAAALFFTPRGRRDLSPVVAGLPRRAHVIPFGDETLRAWSWGGGPTVLLAHGWEGDAAQLRAFVAPLVAEGYRVVAFDMPAHGRSSGRQVGVAEMAHAIATIAEALGPVHAIVAHSLGGAATALAISRGLAVARVVLLAPAAEPTFFARRAAAMMGLPDEQRDGMLRLIEARLGQPLSTLDVRRLAPKLRAALLVMHDPEDSEVPWAHGLGIAEAWPDARLERLTGLGHRRLLRDAQVITQTVAFVDGGELRRSL
jgi:pimeloyl-ACP methyl ester carboxylesterase